MAHPANKIKLKSGDLIVDSETGHTVLLVRRFKGQGGNYYWSVLDTLWSAGLPSTGGALRVLVEKTLRHSLYGSPNKFTLVRKKNT
jgi:hypothetical protein